MDYQFTAACGKKRECSPSLHQQTRTQGPLSPDYGHATKRRKAIPTSTAPSQGSAVDELNTQAQSEARPTEEQVESLGQDRSSQTVSIIDQLSERIEKLEGVQRMQGGDSEPFGEEEEQQIKTLKEIREMLHSMAESNNDYMEVV